MSLGASVALSGSDSWQDDLTWGPGIWPLQRGLLPGWLDCRLALTIGGESGSGSQQNCGHTRAAAGCLILQVDSQRLSDSGTGGQSLIGVHGQQVLHQFDQRALIRLNAYTSGVFEATFLKALDQAAVIGRPAHRLLAPSKRWQTVDVENQGSNTQGPNING